MVALLLAGCSQDETSYEKDRISVGIMLSDNGLGDQSFSDTGFQGALKARDELGITFNYKEIAETKTYEQGFEELVTENHDLIIGLGFNILEDLEKVAKKHPEQQYILIDSSSEIKNITNINFKEEEGSYLIGMIAGMNTKSNKVGFIGGFDTPLINKFAAGFQQGVKAVNPKAKVYIEYANDFGNEKKGAEIAGKFIKKGVDYIYPAAGLTGSGALKEAEKKGVYSFGVDSDQYYVAEKSVVSSMIKNVDVAIYEAVKTYRKENKLEKNITLGLNDNGVDTSAIRLISSDKITEKLEETKKQIVNGEITVNAELKEGK